jgi:hypothetical protein
MNEWFMDANTMIMAFVAGPKFLPDPLSFSLSDPRNQEINKATRPGCFGFYKKIVI